MIHYKIMSSPEQLPDHHLLKLQTKKVNALTTYEILSDYSDNGEDWSSESGIDPLMREYLSRDCFLPGVKKIVKSLTEDIEKMQKSKTIIRGKSHWLSVDGGVRPAQFLFQIG